MKEKEYVRTAIDDIDNLNARFYAGLTEEAAVKELLTSHKDKDEAWAKKAYKQMVADVKAADTPKKEDTAAASK